MKSECLFAEKSVNNCRYEIAYCYNFACGGSAYFADADGYIVYCRKTDLPHEDNGLGKEVRCYGDIGKTLAKCKYVDGVTVCLPADTDVDAIVERLAVSVCSSQKIANVYVFCGYSTLVKGGIYVD